MNFGRVKHRKAAIFLQKNEQLPGVLGLWECVSME